MEPNVTRFQDYLTRIFDLKSHQSGSNVLDDVMPVLSLIEDGSPEYSWPRGEIGFAAFASIGAVAAQYCRALIQPPPNGILVIEGIDVLCGAAMSLGACWAAASPLTTKVQAFPIDTRAAPNPQNLGVAANGPVILSTDTNAGGIGVTGSPIANCTVAANTWTPLLRGSDRAVVLAWTPVAGVDIEPGIAVNTTIVNTLMQIIVRGYYRLNIAIGETR